MCVFRPTGPSAKVQFDGSAHRSQEIRGAGAALFYLSQKDLELVDWRAYALPTCQDNVVAETFGANIAIELYEYWTSEHFSNSIPPPLHTVQGDIKPLLQHLQFTGRLRRADLIELISRSHRNRSVAAPTAQLLYRPREVNFVADYLAGQGSGYLQKQLALGERLPCAPPRLNVNIP